MKVELTSLVGNHLGNTLVFNIKFCNVLYYLFSKASINIHLRAIKTMFRDYLKIETLTKIPIIDQLKFRYSDPIYITDNEFQSIMELDW